MVAHPWSNVVRAIQLALPDAQPWSHFDTIGLRFTWARMVDVIGAYHRARSPKDAPWDRCEATITLNDGRSFSLPIPLPRPDIEG